MPSTPTEVPGKNDDADEDEDEVEDEEEVDREEAEKATAEPDKVAAGAAPDFTA